MLLGLSIGGDDYICKPYSLGVLLAKVKATLKRYETDGSSENIVSSNESDRNSSNSSENSIDSNKSGSNSRVNSTSINANNSGININNSSINTTNSTLNTNRSANTREYIIDVGNVKLDKRKACIIKDDESIMLKAMEYKLLIYMIKNKNRILTKDELFEKVWETDYVGDVTLNVHIRHLREKIEEDASNPQYIKTVWGRGFMLEMNE
ncbi:MAG: response regulator transcription factor [Eubacterium sp.]|nr:response regulator transcription factor [Eubacterium sp.]